MLMADEFELTSPVEGSSGFAQSFSARGSRAMPKDVRYTARLANKPLQGAVQFLDLLGTV